MTWAVLKTIAGSLLTKQVPVWVVVCLLIVMTLVFVTNVLSSETSYEAMKTQTEEIKTQQKVLKIAFSAVQQKIDSSNAKSEAYFQKLDTLIDNALQHELNVQLAKPIGYRSRKNVHAK